MDARQCETARPNSFGPTVRNFPFGSPFHCLNCSSIRAPLLHLLFLSLYTESVRILLLNLYFPPDTSATAKMAQTVVDALSSRHDVTVLCGRPSYDPTERRPWRISQSETSGRVRIIRVGSTDYPRLQMKKRVFNYLSYVLLAVPRSLFIPCDVILAYDRSTFRRHRWRLHRRPQTKALRLQHSRHVSRHGRWRLDRPAWPAFPHLGDDSIAGRFAGPLALSFLAKICATASVSKGIPLANISVVRDGAELPSPDAPAPTLDQAVIHAIRGNFRFVLLHAGNLGFYGAWDTLLAGARQLSEEGVGLVFVGEGAQRDSLSAAAKDIPNVRFLPFFPGSKIPSVLAAADAHLITVKRGLEGVVVPSKMYGILAAGKPIIAVAPRECDVVSLGVNQGFALAADPDDPAAFVDAVRQIACDPQRLKQMATAASAAAPRFERSGELRKLVTIIERAAQK